MYEESNKPKLGMAKQEKLMASTIRVGTAGRWNAGNTIMAESEDTNFRCNFISSSDGSTVFSIGFSEPCASFGTKKKTYQRRRPPKSRRKPRPLLAADKEDGVLWDKAAGKRVKGSKKRKVDTEIGDLLVSPKSKTPKVIPRDGLSNF